MYVYIEVSIHTIYMNNNKYYTVVYNAFILFLLLLCYCSVLYTIDIANNQGVIIMTLC